jgi:UDP-N-acetylglucosamine--N-acetylmuramyl-(pentapeptide) pyrophosphoryl-undecaprenol N-acetylglucosamine transferase
VRVLVSGGGTAGHIYPALAVARLLADEGSDTVALVGAPDSLEQRLATEAGVRFVAVRAQGWDRARPLTFITAVLTTLGSLARCVSLLRRERIDVVCGFGGYVSLPLGLAAVLAGVPLVIHEQNAVPGVVNRVLARWADAVCLTYPDSTLHLRGRVEPIVTGDPVRASVLAADRDAGRAVFGAGEKDTALLVFGGSRGARHLNTAIIDLYPRLSVIDGLRVVQIAGPSEAAGVREALARAAGGRTPSWWAVREYVDAMGDLVVAADLVVCRAGATTLAELSALARPMVLVPYPYATDDHQTRNALPFVEAGGAEAVADSQLDSPEFEAAVVGLLRDPERRARMARNAGELGRPHAAEAVLDAIRAAVRARPARRAVRDDGRSDGKGAS